MANNRHTCATCAHDGQCADLHYCGGSCWTAEDEDDEDVEDREESDPWDGYDEREAMEERGWALQAVWDREW